MLFADVPVIIAGDMNAEPDSREMAVIEEWPAYANVTEGIGITFHCYGQKKYSCSIDYIFTKGFACENVEKWEDERDGVFLSDHYPVCAVLRPEASQCPKVSGDCVI